MTVDTSLEIPSEPSAFKKFALFQLQQISEQQTELESQQTEITELKQQVHLLQEALIQRNKKLFGKSSEKDLEHPDLFSKGEEFKPEAEEERKEAEPKLGEAKPNKRNGRKKLPKELKRVRLDYHPTEVEENRNDYSHVGEEITELLEYVPASMFIKEIARHKYRHKESSKIIIAKAPGMEQPLAKARPGAGLLAQILVSKYQEHSPLNRQGGMFERHGLEISRQTLCDWTDRTADLLQGLGDALDKEVLSANYIGADETPVVQADREGKNGYFWVFMSREEKACRFKYSTSRSSETPNKFLEGFSGYLQADDYAGYNGVFSKPEIKQLGCLAHARRKFIEAKETDPERCKVVIELIKQLYKVEKRLKGKKPEEVQAERKKHAKPILSKLKTKLDYFQKKVLPKSLLAKAINYSLNNWEALTAYLEDGQLKIDNNDIERQIRPVAIGRKNWMMTGSTKGGQNAALFYSLIASCKLNHVDPFTYFNYAIRMVASGVKPEALTPSKFAKIQV